MRRQDFYYDLPDSLIARFPTAERSGSRLLHLDGVTGNLVHSAFSQLPAFLKPGDLLVFNDTKVIPARLYGHKSTGGKVEILIERILSKSRALAHLRASKPPAPGAEITLENGVSIKVTERRGSLFLLSFNSLAIFSPGQLSLNIMTQKKRYAAFLKILAPQYSVFLSLGLLP